MNSTGPGPLLRRLGTVDYADTLLRMQEFTARRDAGTRDELWLLQHPAVFTQGVAGKAEHLLAPGDIPVLQVDRGGQVTYHGPGQWVLYLLLDLKRRRLGVRALVDLIEQSIVATLDTYGICGEPDRQAPGVYVDGAKIASLGLRVRRGCSYHGLSLNVCPDLEPFQRINPCGYAGLAVTSMETLLGRVSEQEVGERLLATLQQKLYG